MKKERYTRIKPNQIEDLPTDKIIGLKETLEKIDERLKKLEQE